MGKETMQRFFVTATCAAMFASSVTAAFAAKPYPTTPPRNPNVQMPANSIMVGIGPQGHRVLVTFRFGSRDASPQTTSYAVTADGTISPLPNADQQSYPLSGVALVIRKTPGPPSASFAVLPDARGVRTVGGRLPAGTYDIIVSLPARAIDTNAPRTARMSAPSTAMGMKVLTFHIIVDGSGNMSIDQKLLPNVRAAASDPSM